MDNTKKYPPSLDNVQFLTFASRHTTLPFINISLYASNQSKQTPTEPSKQRRVGVRHSVVMVKVRVRG